jgi:hypothetical protein
MAKRERNKVLVNAMIEDRAIKTHVV